MGFCGLIIHASREGQLGTHAARRMIDDAIARHGLRLSIRVYQAIMAQLPV